MKRVPLTCLAALLIVCGCRSQQEVVQKSDILVGILYVTGNEPFTNLSLQTDDGRMHVIRKDSTLLYQDLRKLQGQRVRVHVRPADSKSDSSNIMIERFEVVKDR